MMLFTKNLIKQCKNKNALAESAENFGIHLRSSIELDVKR